jgi:hypothetical protein
MTKPYRKKLIEVALPLDAINKASAREKSIRHGHPSTLHLWWARRPLAAARAVIFAQMVDDPSAHPDVFKTEKAQEKERQRLFRVIEDLVLWENTTNETVLQAARDEIWQSWRHTCAENADHPRAKELLDRHKLPAFHNPFTGDGSITTSGNEILSHLRMTDDFILPIVKFFDFESHRVPFSHQPFTREKGFDLKSVTYKLAKALEPGEAPGWRETES